MDRVTYRDWVLDVDVEATRTAYARAPTGDAESCGCAYCRNFIAARSRVYPAEVLDLFGRLGIDPAKEGEAYQTHRSDDGMHHYGGWLHAVGEFVSGPAARVPCSATGFQIVMVAITPEFGLAIGPDAGSPPLEPLRGARLIRIEFDVSVPWVCDLPDPCAGA